jgi:hypothetical protein
MRKHRGGVPNKYNIEGGNPMNLEVIESGERDFEPAGMCQNFEFFSACCIIHFWGWEPGTGVCC